MKYRKKPVVVEAVQWNGNNHKEVIDFAENKIWFDALGNIWIATLEGDMVAKKGIILSKACKENIIHASRIFLQKHTKKRRNKNVRKSKTIGITRIFALIRS
ncbi:phage protein [Streptococcus pneumoniae]|nr:phage protein [Streptococcus pneumoniae]